MNVQRGKMMFPKRLFVTAAALLAITAPRPLSACMTGCSCSPDLKGRNAMICKEGGIVGPLDLEKMDRSTEILVISAPENNANSLTMMPAFDEFEQLEEIHITRSNIPQLGEHFFYRLANLSVLNLSQNNITQVVSRNFLGLEKLRELYLDDNRIYSLPSGTFNYLKQLKILSIQRNRIAELSHSVFLDDKKLRVLKLSGNPLRELKLEAFRDVQELRTLECKGCALMDVNAPIYALLPHLNHLDLGDNRIDNLRAGDFKNLKALKHLKLDGNHLVELRDFCFGNAFELKTLTLARNRLQTISSSAFTNLDNLVELDLSFNKIAELAFLLVLKDNLLVLKLSGNPLDLNANKATLTALNIRELRLSRCELLDVPRGVFPSSLISLDLSGNYLIVLDAAALPEGLYHLDLSGNKFRGIANTDLLDKIETINVTILDGNPWSCDLCFIVPIMDRMNGSSAFRDIVCAQPYVVEGKRLDEVDRHLLTWCTPSYFTGDANFFAIERGTVGLAAALVCLCLLFVVVVAVVATLCYSRRHAAKYYTHEDKLGGDDGVLDADSRSPFFCDDKEFSFKFPSSDNVDEKRKVTIATIDEIKREQENGT